TTDDDYLPIGPRSDHRIGVYPEARQAVLLAWLRTQSDDKSRAEADRLAGQLSQHWVNEADQRLRAGRFTGAMGAFREALKIAPNPTTRQQLQEVMKRQSELESRVQEAGELLRRRPVE